MSSSVSCREGGSTPAVACRMGWRGAGLETRRKARGPTAVVIQERDGGGPDYHDDTGVREKEGN